MLKPFYFFSRFSLPVRSFSVAMCVWMRNDLTDCAHANKYI